MPGGTRGARATAASPGVMTNDCAWFVPPERQAPLYFNFPHRGRIINCTRARRMPGFIELRPPRRAHPGAIAMVAYQAGRSVGMTFLLAAVATAAAQEKDAAPTALTPQAVLKGHNLEHSGTIWILASAEKTVFKDLADARALYQQVYQGTMRQQELEMGAEGRKGDIQTLREQSDILSQQIAALNQQLSTLVSPPGGNSFVNQQRTQLTQAHNVLVAQHGQVVNMLNAAPGTGQGPGARAETPVERRGRPEPGEVHASGPRPA